MNRFSASAILLSVLLAACDGRDDGSPAGAQEGGAREGRPPEASESPSPADPPVPAPADPQGWKTADWPMPRGGPALQGRVHDPVPRNPEVEWSIELDGPVIADAAIANGTVYVGSILGTFYALDLATGEERWKFEAEDTIEAPPSVAHGRVFVGSNDRFFYCLDAESGKEIWKHEGADKFSSGALMVRSPDDTEDWVIVNGYDGICRCLRVADGSEVWTYRTDEQINGMSAIVNGESVVFGGCDSIVHSINVTDGLPRNEVVVDAEIIGTIATMGTMTYSANYANQLVAADAFGEKLTWIYEDEDFGFYAAPAVNAELVFIGSRDKHLHAVNRETGARAWKFKTGARVDGSALVFNDAVVFGSRDGRLYALAPKDGSEIWRLDLGEGFDTAPAFANGRLVLGGSDGTLFCIKGEKTNE